MRTNEREARMRGAEKSMSCEEEEAQRVYRTESPQSLSGEEQKGEQSVEERRKELIVQRRTE